MGVNIALGLLGGRMLKKRLRLAREQKSSLPRVFAGSVITLKPLCLI